MYAAWPDNSAFGTSCENPVLQQQPLQQQVGVRLVRKEDARNPHLLQPCGNILPKPPSFREIQQSPPAFRKLWGGQHVPQMTQ
jgi:hypothetical protein